MNNNEFNPFRMCDEMSHNSPYYVVKPALPLWSDGYLTCYGAEIARLIGNSDSYLSGEGNCFYIYDKDLTNRVRTINVDDELLNGVYMFFDAQEYIEKWTGIGVIPMGAFVKYGMQCTFDEDTYEVWCWIKENIKGMVLWDYNHLVFEHHTEAALFAIKFLESK